MNCYIHGTDCFISEKEWQSIQKRNIRDLPVEHIAKNELTEDYIGEVKGPATAIAKLHILLRNKNYEEGDKLKNKYKISVFKNGYIAWKDKL